MKSCLGFKCEIVLHLISRPINNRKFFHLIKTHSSKTMLHLPCSIIVNNFNELLYLFINHVLLIVSKYNTYTRETSESGQSGVSSLLKAYARQQQARGLLSFFCAPNPHIATSAKQAVFFPDDFVPIGF